MVQPTLSGSHKLWPTATTATVEASSAYTERAVLGPIHLNCSMSGYSMPRIGLHAGALALFSRAWLWHLSPKAALLPGSQGFGWFFK